MLAGIYDGACITELTYSNRLSSVPRNECVFFVPCASKGDLTTGLPIHLKKDAHAMILMH